MTYQPVERWRPVTRIPFGNMPADELEAHIVQPVINTLRRDRMKGKRASRPLRRKVCSDCVLIERMM